MSAKRSVSYKSRDGVKHTFEAASAITSVFGFNYLDPVDTPRGVGTVIGVLDGNLWFHIKNDTGASHFDGVKGVDSFKRKNVKPADFTNFEIVYASRSGDSTIFSIDPEKLRLHGFKHKDRVTTPKGPATVIGVSEGYLWFHVDGDAGASRWGSCRAAADYAAKGFKLVDQNEDIAPDGCIWYLCKTGKTAEFKVTPADTLPFGFCYKDRVETPRGLATVIGVTDGDLWFHVDGDPGASKWGSCKSKADFDQRKFELVSKGDGRKDEEKTVSGGRLAIAQPTCSEMFGGDQMSWMMKDTVNYRNCFDVTFHTTFAEDRPLLEELWSVRPVLRGDQEFYVVLLTSEQIVMGTLFFYSSNSHSVCRLRDREGNTLHKFAATHFEGFFAEYQEQLLLNKTQPPQVLVSHGACFRAPDDFSMNLVAFNLHLPEHEGILLPPRVLKAHPVENTDEDNDDSGMGDGGAGMRRAFSGGSNGSVPTLPLVIEGYGTKLFVGQEVVDQCEILRVLMAGEDLASLDPDHEPIPLRLEPTAPHDVWQLAFDFISFFAFRSNLPTGDQYDTGLASFTGKFWTEDFEGFLDQRITGTARQRIWTLCQLLGIGSYLNCPMLKYFARIAIVWVRDNE